MCAARRTASGRLTRLAAKASPYHGAVTLYDVAGQGSDEGEAGPSMPRQATRVEEAEPSGADARGAGAKRVGMVAKKTRRRVKPKGKVGDDDGPEADPDAAHGAGAPSSRPRSVSPKKKTNPSSKPKGLLAPLAVPHPAPERWADVYAAIKDMRARVVAPVDTMGCDQAQWKEREPKNQRFATLVSLMLSSQTKDEVTDAAVSQLRTAIGGTLSVRAILDADDATVSGAIAKVGFWRRKTQYLKQTAQRLRDDFDADVPKTVEELCSLPGVGPKMAFLALQVAWQLNVGIGVDVHVHRITNRLGWHDRPTKNPEETRRNLESWLPKELHGDINHMLVGFGQTICLPVGPKCGECTLSVGGLCPSAQYSKGKGSKSAGARKKVSSSMEEIEVEEGSGPKVDIEIEILRDHAS